MKRWSCSVFMPQSPLPLAVLRLAFHRRLALLESQHFSPRCTLPRGCDHSSDEDRATIRFEICGLMGDPQRRAVRPEVPRSAGLYPPPDSLAEARRIAISDVRRDIHPMLDGAFGLL